MISRLNPAVPQPRGHHATKTHDLSQIVERIRSAARCAAAIHLIERDRIASGEGKEA